VVGAALVIAGQKVKDWLPSFDTASKATQVRLQGVTVGPLVETASAPGDISPFVKVNISAEVSARILELPFREGERVSKGEVVVRLDAREYKADLEAHKLAATVNGFGYRRSSRASPDPSRGSRMLKLS